MNVTNRSIRALLLLAAILQITTACQASEPKARPNIVFIFIDDMGYADPSCFGNPHVKTPNIDRLASEGIRLTNFYVNSPICSASRVAVTTGHYPGRWKIHSFLNMRKNNKLRGMNNFLPREAPTTAKKLQAAGYATAHFGKWHMGGGRDVDDAPLPTEYGFDESLVAFEGLGDRLLDNPKNSSAKLGRGEVSFCKRWEKTEKYTDRTIDFIRRNKDKPFYVRLFPNDVHDPHVALPGSDAKWKAVTENPWEQKFFAVLEEMDRQIGRVVDEVETLGLSEKTLFVFTSDNGPTDWRKYYTDNSGGPPGSTGPFFGRKWSLFEGGIRMPFIARWKGTIPAGVTDETSTMAAIDLSPTFCHFAGVEVPNEEKLDGVPRCDMLLGKPSRRSKPVFWQYGSPHAYLQPGRFEFRSPTFAMRDGQWKLLRNANGSSSRLYDLVADPGEKSNLLKQQPARAQQMSRQLANWAKSVGYEFNTQSPLRVPEPLVLIPIDSKITAFQNNGVIADADRLQFDGKSWLSIPKLNAPKVAKRPLRVEVDVQTANANGVILAHGGDKTGYSLYVKDHRLHFSVCVGRKRTTIAGQERLDASIQRVVANWDRKGRMSLAIAGREVATGQTKTLLQSEPGDSLQIGTDLIQPVGDYDADTAGFSGVLKGLNLSTGR